MSADWSQPIDSGNIPNTDSNFDLNKSDLSLQDYYISNSKCTPTDHNEIRERVRKEQESIRSGYKITN